MVQKKLKKSEQLFKDLSKLKPEIRASEGLKLRNKLRGMGFWGGLKFSGDNESIEVPILEPEKFPDLFSLYVYLNTKMVEAEFSHILDFNTYRVNWYPFEAWKQSGYTNKKLNSLIGLYISPDEIKRCREMFMKGTGDFTFTFRFKKREGSKMRLEGCLSTIIFRVRGLYIYPLIIFRISEISKRLIADLVLIDNIFKSIFKGDYEYIKTVDIIFNQLWLPQFSLYFISKALPEVKKIVDKKGLKVKAKTDKLAMYKRLVKSADEIINPINNSKSDFPEINLEEE